MKKILKGLISYFRKKSFDKDLKDRMNKSKKFIEYLNKHKKEDDRFIGLRNNYDDS